MVMRVAAVPGTTSARIRRTNGAMSRRRMMIRIVDPVCVRVLND
jgi:hypothetical protein